MHKSMKLGLGTATALVALFAASSQSAYADYAPGSGDVVGVGSDTVQYAIDFLADGDVLGDGGYNTGGNPNKLINFDATTDANARLAYGPNGGGPTCSPGTGATVGTGNATATHPDSPCVLDPTVVLRAGLNPVQRPNGSGAGAKALKADTNGVISFSRASSSQAGSGGTLAGGGYDSVTIGQDPLAILEASSTHAVPLSATQLNSIYTCSPSARTWSQVGGTSTDTIVPILPQLGSGTRSSFLSAIGNPTPGDCVINAEENDPEAVLQSYVALATTATATSGTTSLSLDSVGGPKEGSKVVTGQLVTGAGIPAGTTVTALSGTTATISQATTAALNTAPVTFTAQSSDIVEPLSGGRLNLFLGKLGDGSSNGVGGYFKDPTCAFGVSTPAACAGTASTLKPAVKLDTASGAFNISRPLYIYFRDADVNSTVKFQPGNNLNWVRTLFYNPCNSGATGCQTIGGVTYGPGGAPYVATAAGQALISAAGINPAYTPTVGGS